MSDDTCDIHDVTKAASDLVAFGCSIGATQLYDSFLQLQFSSIVSSYANEIIQAVDEGIISAWQGIQEIREEYAELSSKVLFYTQNGVGVLAGAMQIKAGVSMIGGTAIAGIIPGTPLIAHGFNNIYEGAGNIHNGPGAPVVVGPIRELYQYVAGNNHKGNMAYYSADLILSAISMSHFIRKPGSTQLFNRDPINYERAYKQTGKLALFFESLVDAITIRTMIDENKAKVESK